MDIDGIAEADGRGKLALCADAWPADELVMAQANQVDSGGFKEVALGGFHIFEEVGEMYESGHIGLGKLNSPCGCVFARHV